MQVAGSRSLVLTSAGRRAVMTLCLSVPLASSAPPWPWPSIMSRASLMRWWFETAAEMAPETLNDICTVRVGDGGGSATGDEVRGRQKRSGGCLHAKGFAGCAVHPAHLGGS